MVYLAELLVVMTDGLKIDSIRARNMPRTRTQAVRRRRRRVSCFSLPPGKRRCRVLMRRGAVLFKHKKIVSGQPAHVWQWPLSKKIVATVCPLHFDTKSEQYDSNKSSARKNLENIRL